MNQFDEASRDINNPSASIGKSELDILTIDANNGNHIDEHVIESSRRSYPRFFSWAVLFCLMVIAPSIVIPALPNGMELLDKPAYMEVVSKAQYLTFFIYISSIVKGLIESLTVHFDDNSKVNFFNKTPINEGLIAAIAEPQPVDSEDILLETRLRNLLAGILEDAERGTSIQTSPLRVSQKDFVQFLAEDAENHPEKLVPFTADMLAHANKLLAGVELN
jgi:hypothetical protein